MIRAIGRAAASRAATAIKPCGANVAVSAATMIATAAGTSRRLAIAVSASTQVRTVPKAIKGSGRRPLLNGSQAARNTAPAVHTATRLPAKPPRPGPSRRSMQRLMTSHVPMPASVAGSRIHTPAVLTDASWASTDWYQSKGASLAPK